MASVVSFRTHLYALLGAEPDEASGLEWDPLGEWRVGVVSEWGLSEENLDWRLSRATRGSGGLAIRASTIDETGAVVSVHHAGMRLAIFQHALGGLRFDEVECQLAHSKNRSVETTDHRDEGDPLEFGDLDEEILARVGRGVEAREAWDATTRGRADRLMELLETVGVEADRGRLLAVLRGETELARAYAENPSGSNWDETWVDVPDLFEAMGVLGLRAWVVEWMAEVPGPEADDSDETGTSDEAGSPARVQSGRFAYGIALFLILVGGVAGGLWGARYGWLAAVGGAGLATAALATLALLVFARRLIVAAIQVVLAWRRQRREQETFDAASDGIWMRSQVTRHLAPALVDSAKVLLADWADLVGQLRPEPGTDAPGYLDGYAFLTGDPGGRALARQLLAGEDPRPLARRVAALRLRLLDTEIEGGQTAALRAELDALSAELARGFGR